ncbi:MAG: hypothetical protein ACREL1_03900 [bacterium]
MAFSTVRGKWSVRYLGLALVFALLGAGCRSAKSLAVNQLPLPPVADSGLVNGEYLQAYYGFAIPVPAHWSLLRLSEEEEVDEVARLSDPQHHLIARVTVHLQDPTQDFSDKEWESETLQQFSDSQLTLVKKGDSDEVDMGGGLEWKVQDYQLEDGGKRGWFDQEWLLRRNDLLIWVHVELDQPGPLNAEGKKLLETLGAALSKLHWYMPIGERGISEGLYDLDHFTAGFCDDLQSGSTRKVDYYFDDLYPGKPQWDEWYKTWMADVPSKASAKVTLTGLILNGQQATAIFTFTKKEKSGVPVPKAEKGFTLSKKEGSWKIVAPLKL